MIAKYILGCALVFNSMVMPCIGMAQSQTTPKQAQVPAQSQAAPAKSGQTHSEGERLFAQNCSRCHTAPDGFSPRISGTVLRHMRVRAQLSQHDEQELLRFFNP